LQLCKKTQKKHISLLIVDIDIISNHSLDSFLTIISQRVKERRLERNLTQKAFAKRAGVGYDAYRKFENSGEITLHNLILCAIALDDTDGFTELFAKKTYQNMEELLKTKERKRRERGSTNE